MIVNSPTATGKTKLAVNLAQRYGGEIISADSLQVYRYLDIGTAKPSFEERKKVRHHLIDVVDPDEEFNAAIFARQAHSIIDELARSGKRAFVVGGTGLYIRALLQGMIDTPAVDAGIRNHYRRLCSERGKEHLYQLLIQKDEESARRINPNDSVRIIRALEVWEQTGKSIVHMQKRHAFGDCRYHAYKIGLKLERTKLKQKIETRTDEMIEAGLLSEVKSLLARGYDENIKPMQSLGYKQIMDFLKGRRNWEQTVQIIKRQTWLYAKRQMTWFAADHDIKWYAPESTKEIEENVDLFFKNYGPGGEFE